MNVAIAVLVLLCVVVVAAGIAGSVRFTRLVAALAERLAAAPLPRDVAAALPEPVRAFALRADANPADLARSVELSQEVEMQLKPGQPWQLLTATQIVATGAPGLLWQARQALGPLPKFQVLDSLADGRGRLTVLLFGLIRVVDASGPKLDRGEAQRYLAELPWAPDAILGNPALRWRMLDDDWAEVSMDVADGPVALRLRFDAAGDIVEVFAEARDTTDDEGNPVALPWQGIFRDYRMIGARRIPAEGEVGYIRPEGFRPYWQGRITGYSVTH